MTNEIRRIYTVADIFNREDRFDPPAFDRKSEMPCCAVSSCSTYNRKTAGTNVAYHSFPRDPTLCKLWIQKCKRKDKFCIANARICSKHFTQSDYVRDLKAELLGLPPKRVLNSSAVPSVNLSCDDNLEPVDGGDSNRATVSVSGGETSESRESRCYARMVRKRALETLASLPPRKSTADRSTMTDKVHISAVDEESSAKEIALLKSTVANLASKCVTLQARNRYLHLQVMSSRRHARNLIPACNVRVKGEVKRILGKIFTRSQIHCLMEDKRCVAWKAEDMRMAVTLYVVSKKCYAYLRNELKIPLPGVSTIKRWLARTCS